MLLHVVLDPAALDVRHFDNPTYLFQLRAALKGILANGMLVVDDAGVIRSDLIRAIAELPQEHHARKAIEIAFTDIGKSPRSKMVSCAVHAITDSTEASGVAVQLAANCKVDAFLTERPVPRRPNLDVAPISNYLDSSVEESREKMLSGPPLDELTPAVVNATLGRIFRFARRVTLYDAQLGRGTNNKGFREGIAFLLARWKQAAHSAAQITGLEIMTRGDKQPWRDTKNIKATEIHERNREAVSSIQREIVEPLEGDFGVSVTLHVKEDRGHIMHRRILETDRALFSVDRGFDLFARGGNQFRRNWIEFATSLSREVADYRRLPTVIYKDRGVCVAAGQP